MVMNEGSEVKIGFHKFLPEMAREVHENIGKTYLLATNVGGLIVLGGLTLGLAGDKLYPAMFLGGGGLIALMPGMALMRTILDVYDQTSFDKVYPGIVEGKLIGLDTLKAVVIDKVNAVVPEQGADPLRFKPQSLIPYKKRLISEFAKTINTETATDFLFEMLLETQDLELKQFMTKMLKNMGKII